MAPLRIVFMGTPDLAVASLEALLVGVAPTAVEATLASVGYVVGDIDK